MASYKKVFSIMASEDLSVLPPQKQVTLIILDMHLRPAPT